MDDKRNCTERQSESTYYGYWRDIYGKLVPVGTFVHNGRTVPRPPFAMTVPEPEQPDDQDEGEESPSYLELEKVAFYNLNDIERKIARLAMRDAKPTGEIAEIIGVSRPAISQRLRRLAKKNPCVRMWWLRKKKVNQHA
jgi:hypothetical protein